MKTNNNSSNSSWTASKLTNQYVTLKNHIINYGYLYNGSEIKFGIILIHVIFDVMAIIKTTANLINTNGFFKIQNPINLKLNGLCNILNTWIPRKNFICTVNLLQLQIFAVHAMNWIYFNDTGHSPSTR